MFGVLSSVSGWPRKDQKDVEAWERAVGARLVAHARDPCDPGVRHEVGGPHFSLKQGDACASTGGRAQPVNPGLARRSPVLLPIALGESLFRGGQRL